MKTYLIKAEDLEIAAWKAAAKKAGSGTMAPWIRTTLNRAARKLDGWIPTKPEDRIKERKEKDLDAWAEKLMAAGIKEEQEEAGK